MVARLCLVKQTIKLSIILLLCFLSACRAPDAINAFGDPLFLKDYQSKWIIINYWADWCKPCYQEIPALNQLYQAHTDELVVFGVNFDAMSAEKMQQFIQQYHVQYPMLLTDIGKKFGIKDVPTLPTTVVISPAGEVIAQRYGEQKENELVEVIRQYQKSLGKSRV